MKKEIIGILAISIVTAAQQSNAGSLSVEGDALAYALNGYSAILRKNFDNGLDIALGGGRFDMPKFVLESEQSNYSAQKWEAKCKSIIVFRIGYRWSQAYEDGFSTHLIAMNQNWNVKSGTQNSQTDFTTLNIGLSAGYTYHIGHNFYLYPTAAYTLNSVSEGKTQVGGVKYDVKTSGINGSLHAGFEF